jgi:predicted transcriptional regulator
MRRRLQMSVRTRLPRERFQDLLETLSPGDEIQVTSVSKTTGLDAATCESVLEALVRVDLFTRTRERVFVRRRMLEALDRLHA